ncbi:hypothetical protein ACFE04_008093 [Oxalis oulophora]
MTLNTSPCVETAASSWQNPLCLLDTYSQHTFESPPTLLITRPSSSNHYLKSDAYMFAHMFSPLPFGLETPKTVSFSHSVEVAEPIVLKAKKLREKIDDYFKSDSHMYAPLVDPHRFDRGPSKLVKIVTTEISVRTTVESNSGNAQSTKLKVVDNTTSESNLIETGGRDRKGTGYKETVKRMGYQTCRSNSVSGETLENYSTIFLS